MDKRISLSIVALFLAAVIAATLPNSALFAPAPQDRQKQVISAFINATVDPGQGGVIKTDWLVSNRQLRKQRHARLAHVHPDVLAAFAADRGMTVAAYRDLLADPQRDDPFELSGAVFDITQHFATGTSGNWHWALMPETGSARPAEEGCRMWLILWDDSHWYYAPAERPDHQAATRAALPEFDGLFLNRLPDCPQPPVRQ